MVPELLHSREISPSKFYMWRTIIAIAHVDGHVCQDERAYLEGVFERLRDDGGLDDSQYAMLMDDLDTAQDTLDMLKRVDDPRYRGQILHFAQMLASKDGEVCEAEQRLIDQMHAEISRDMDVDPIRTELLNSLDDESVKTHGTFVALMEQFISSTGLKG